MFKRWMVVAFCAGLLVAGGLVAAQETPEPVPEPTYNLPLMLPGELPPGCKTHAVNRRAQFALADSTQGAGADVVFAGDSLVEGWAMPPRLPGRKILNRGISCDTTNGLHERLLRDVVVHKPKIAVILIGVNDLHLLSSLPTWDRARQVAINVPSLAVRLRGHDIKPLVLSLLPVRVPLPGLPVSEANRTIRDLNADLRRDCRQMGAAFFDANRVVADGRGWLKEEFTEDGLHLNFTGYQHLNRLLAPELKRLLGD